MLKLKVSYPDYEFEFRDEFPEHILIKSKIDDEEDLARIVKLVLSHDLHLSVLATKEEDESLLMHYVSKYGEEK